MIKHNLSLHGQATKGSRISGLVLRELLDIIIDGSRGALRLKLEGRSIVRGTDPAWLEKAAEFDFISTKPGSTVIEIESLPLAEAVPDRFQQGNFFYNNLDTAFDFMEASLTDALNESSDSDLFDDSLLDVFCRFQSVLNKGYDSINITNGVRKAPLVITSIKLDRVRELQRKTPQPQFSRVSGHMNMIRASDKTFELVLANGESIRGVAPASYGAQELGNLFGKTVLISGKVVYRPSGSILRIEADMISTANNCSSIWAKAPKARKLKIESRDLHRKQTSTTGLSAIWGKWPGSETDDEIRKAL